MAASPGNIGEIRGMICQSCHGTRWVPAARHDNDATPAAAPPAQIPCPDCLGGEQHCCEGLTACNDAVTPDA